MHAGRRYTLLFVSGVMVLGATSLALSLRPGGDDMRHERTLLLTGFGPFGPYDTNPAWEVARSLDGVLVGRTRVRAARLDVVYADAALQLDQAFRRNTPSQVLCLGVAPGDALRLETLARNRDRSGEADNAGVVRSDEPIREGAPELLPTGLPVKAILARLHADGHPVRTSDDAGGYVCNHVFYVLMADRPDRSVAGFVHVPPLAAPWDEERLQAAIRAIIEVLDATD